MITQPSEDQALHEPVAANGSFAMRLAITLLVPFVLVMFARYVTLPSIPGDLVESGTTSSVSPFALGVVPILTAYWLVEVVAFLVPRWSRLRHGDPNGRAKLERAVLVVALVSTGVQAFSTALSLQALGQSGSTDRSLRRAVEGSAFIDAEFSISVPLVTITLIGGVWAAFMAAQWVSRRGLVNGLVTVHVAFMINILVESVQSHWLSVSRSPRELAVELVVIAIAVAATWTVLRGAGEVPPADAHPDKDSASGNPYRDRDARALAVRPVLPLPSSSFQIYGTATSVLMIPLVAMPFVPGLSPVAEKLGEGGSTYVMATFATIVVLTVVFSRFMHRPAEMVDLAVRLGAKRAERLAREAHRAWREALGPTLLYFTVLLAAQHAAPFGMIWATVLVLPAFFDLFGATRLHFKERDLVPVWTERRAATVPVLRAMLGSKGIATHTRGMAVLSFWQVFAPYAPAEILVRPEDAAKARQWLLHLFAGADEPRYESAPDAPAPEDGRLWSVGRRSAVLAICAVATIPALLHTRWPGLLGGRAGALASERQRPVLEIVRVDDAIDVFAQISDDRLPEGEGIAIYRERAPLGPGRHQETHFARIALREGESKPEAMGRFRRWLSTVPLRDGFRFGVEPLEEFDEETQEATVVGLRTLVLENKSVLQTEDVTDAAPAFDDTTGRDYVSLTLSADASKRFADATAAWVNRRLAIVLNGEVNSAPVVKAAIDGGRVTITMGAGNPDELRVRAEALATALSAR